ncbi:hypothetical protein EDB85DRAFT_1898760 [Lactarius pseudohatsudake]|nr:hypothetical protein EDB85DRAFT_1898760 [Lactarius pseudohatsudake]
MPAAARPLPSPRRPTFARNGGARGHADLGPSLPIRAEAVRTRAHRPPLPLPLPSCPRHPRSRGKGRARATPHPVAGRSRGKERTRPSHPRLPTCRAGPRRKRRARRRDTPPPLPARARKRGDSAPTVSLGAGDASQASRRPRTQGKGRRAHPVPIRATLAPPRAHHTAPPVHARGGVGVSNLSARAMPASCLRPAMPADAGGSVRPAQPLPRRVHFSVYAGRRRVQGGRTRRVTERGTTRGGANGGRTKGGQCEAGRGATRVPGGAACERRGVHIGAEVRKGEGDGDGGGCRERGEAKPGRGCAREQRHPPCLD